MVKIAPHLVPETQTALDKALACNAPYTPVCDWGEDVTVQWGNGIIPATPFFEAFPPGTFIRGEGDTIEAAERAAFRQYERQRGCKHFFGRYHSRKGTYTNGGAHCHLCGRFEASYFPPIFKLGQHRKPLKFWEKNWLEDDVEEEIADRLEAQNPGWKKRVAKQKKMLAIRMKLYGIEETQNG